MERVKHLPDGSEVYGQGIVGPSTRDQKRFNSVTDVEYHLVNDDVTGRLSNYLKPERRGFRLGLPKPVLSLFMAGSLLVVACRPQEQKTIDTTDTTATVIASNQLQKPELPKIPETPKSPDIPNVQRPSVINPQLLESFRYRIIIQVRYNKEEVKLNKDYFTPTYDPNDLNYDRSTYFRLNGIKGVNFYSNSDPSLTYDSEKYHLTLESAFCPVDGPNKDWDQDSLASYGCSGSVLTRFSTVTANEVVIIDQKLRQ